MSGFSDVPDGAASDPRTVRVPRYLSSGLILAESALQCRFFPVLCSLSNLLVIPGGTSLPLFTSALTRFSFTFLKTSTFYSFFSFQVSLTLRLLPGLPRLPPPHRSPTLVLSYCSFSWPHKAGPEGSVPSGASIERVLPLQFCFLKLFSQIVRKHVFSFWFILQIFFFILFYDYAVIVVLIFPHCPPSPSTPTP